MPRRIYYYPASISSNRYVEVELRILKALCQDIEPLERTSLLRRSDISRAQTVAILNWYEDRMGWYKRRPNVVLVNAILLLILLRVRCKKIVWVRHNFWPLDLPARYFRQHILLFFMRLLTTTTVTHRRVRGMKTSIMPHPLYFEGDLPQSVRDIDFLYFGTIKRYKGLSQLLAVWPSEHRFVIAGAVPDPELYAELREIARTRELDVEFIDRFVPDEELNALLLRTRFALLPHLDDAMIVTGCFYHAASLGVNILARNGELSRNLREDFTFVTLFDDATIGRVIGALHYTEADTVVAEIRRTNGVERCREVWRQIIERS